jgi:poly(3-hydroxybutyrate) depolymerase
MPFTARRSILLICLTLALRAQDADPAALAWMNARVDIQSATVSLRTLRTTSKASDAVKAEVDKLLQEGAGWLASGNTGEVRRRINHSLSLLGGQPWTPKEEFAAALLVRADTRVADASRRLEAHLVQVYPATYQPETGWRLHVTLHEGVPSRVGPAPGKLLCDAGMVEGVSRDLIDEPASFDADLSGCGEGLRVLSVELLDGDRSIRKLWTAIYVVNGLDARRQVIEQSLQKISGHESAKTSVLAPLDLARMINLDRREFARVDFAAELRQSEELLHSLEAGRDPLTQASGNHRRHYYFADAGEIMPYRVYVPSVYKPGAHLPLVVALHGLGGTEDTFLGRSGGLLETLAEKHGFVVAAPLGYRINGQYGSTLRRFTDAARKRTADLSEKDVLNVLKLVSEEYGTDPERTYLMGHSMGGGGTWYLGQKYADKWAAIAPIAAPTADVQNYPFDRLKGMPVTVFHGDQDATVPVESSRSMVAAMKQRGMSPVYVEVAGASHGSVVEVAMPKILDFFAEHTGRQRGN